VGKKKTLNDGKIGLKKEKNTISIWPESRRVTKYAQKIEGRMDPCTVDEMTGKTGYHGSNLEGGLRKGKGSNKTTLQNVGVIQ